MVDLQPPTKKTIKYKMVVPKPPTKNREKEAIGDVVDKIEGITLFQFCWLISEALEVRRSH